MSVSIILPDSFEESLRQRVHNLEQVAKESLLVELYRQERITRYELAAALGIDRFAAEELLARHRVTEDLPVVAEIERQSHELLDRLSR